ncbi:MAG: hypothetical protein CVU44_17665 [Chloroflexi bacterium HGW-Chloroflexi-6]|nr:MAG: hypothetical protein CVU44_17665 [Chloroflexi bacterium HGW-Chloroflexi-6]
MYNYFMETTSETIRWLLQGDPAIRWQVLRDLCDAPAEIYVTERAHVANQGWGAQLLARQDADAHWGGGIYSPKWKSTTYTLLVLRQLGLPPENPQALRGCEKFFFRGLEKDGGINFWKSFQHSETCINGMLLALLSYFRFPDERIHSVAAFLLREQMPDGGWNCERIKGATHASFHTTISVLEGLDEYGARYPENLSAVIEARAKAHEFLLQHRLYQSHRTGEPADYQMTLMHFPPRWRYDFLRGLDYFQRINAPKDERMKDAIELLPAKQNADGTWPLNAPWPGLVYFHMEETGKPSRWNTLRALRVLKWWHS